MFAVFALEPTSMSDKPWSDTDHAVPAAALVRLSSWGLSFEGSVSVSSISCKTSAQNCSKNDGISSYRRKFLLPRWIPLEFVSLWTQRIWWVTKCHVRNRSDYWCFFLWRGVGLLGYFFTWNVDLFSKMIPEGLNFCHYGLVLFHLALRNAAFFETWRDTFLNVSLYWLWWHLLLLSQKPQTL